MARIRIIVEDESDKYTFEAIIRHIKLQNNLSVTATPNIEWKSISKEGYPANALIRGLRDLISDISNEKYDKIAIIRDMDMDSKEEMLAIVNHALAEAFSSEAEIRVIEDVNTLVPFTFKQSGTENPIVVYFSCYFVHVFNEKGVAKGEIEDILKAIKTKPSPIADCIDEHLPHCLKVNNEKQLREKDLVKLWFNHYQRYDTLVKKDRKNPFTGIEFIMQNRTDIFDFDKDLREFNELKNFLRQISE
jgi:hypothetical protein